MFVHAVRSDINTERPRRKLDVWRVTLSDDGISFTARHVNSFWTSRKGIQDISLMGNYFGHTFYGKRLGVALLEIFQWKQSTSNLHHKTVFRLQPPQSVSGSDTKLI